MARTTHRKPDQAAALRPAQQRWLFAMTLCCELPLLPQLPNWLATMCVLLLVWFAALHARHLLQPHTTSSISPKPPPGWLLTTLALVGVAAIGIEYHTLFGRNVGIALLALLCSLKLLEARTVRDGFALALLACFMLLGQFFRSQDMMYAALMLLGVLLVTINLAVLHYPQHAAQPVLRLASRLLLQATPLMLLLFVLFPRIQTPLWGLPADAFAGMTGLSDSMSPGSIAQLSQSGAVAFRVRFSGEYEGHAPRQSSLYWRGPVLNNFDGRNWTVRPQQALSELPYTLRGKPVDYSVTLEAHNQSWLFALELPGRLPDDARMSSDFQLLAQKPVRARLRYDVQSILPAAPILDHHAQHTSVQAALQLPTGYNPRSRVLAEQWRKELRGDARAIARRMLEHLHDEDFYYTLRPPLLGRNSIDELLFETRRGFCEHYAAAFVFMMRAAGIPARVVTGYQGGELNAIDGTLIVRQSDAHAWAEVWFEKDENNPLAAGWQRIDPTAAIAPLRIENSLADALPSEEREILPLVTRLPFPWLHDMRLRLDALSNAWNQWVIGYNQQRQRNLLERFGVDATDWRQLSLLFSVLSGAMMLGLLAWALHVRQTTDPVQTAWQRLSRKLAPLGLARQPWEGPQDYLQRIQATLPPDDNERAETIAAIANLYIRLRYAADSDTPTPAALAQRKTWLRELKQHIARLK
jgi:transglutaminase-like putative cysteine protease